MILPRSVHTWSQSLQSRAFVSWSLSRRNSARQTVVMQVTKPVERDLFINGQWTQSKKGSRLDVICPTTEQVVGSIPKGTAEDVEEAISAAVQTFRGPWSKSRGSERAKFLRAIARQVSFSNSPHM